MLRWRNIDPNRQNWYVECGKILFKEGPDADFPKEKKKDDEADKMSEEKQETQEAAESD